jgi:hypothetical protein
MYVYVFKGTDRIVGFTADVTGGNLPTWKGPWELTTCLQMTKEDDPRPLVDTKDCFEDIEMHGFHITDGKRRITDSLAAMS